MKFNYNNGGINMKKRLKLREVWVIVLLLIALGISGLLLYKVNETFVEDCLNDGYDMNYCVAKEGI